MALSEYSKNEKRLFNSLGYSDNVLSHVTPVGIYKMASIDAFADRKIGENVEALARAMKAINMCNPYRHTSEFEDLISF